MAECLGAEQTRVQTGNRPQQQWQLDPTGEIFLNHTSLCLKPVDPNTCANGTAAWLGQVCEAPHGFDLVGNAIRLIFDCGGSGDGPMCLVPAAGTGPRGVALAKCSSPAAQAGWTRGS